MAIVPDDIIYYEDDDRCYVRVINDSKLVPSIEYYEDDDRTLVHINNRKVIDHKKGESFFDRILRQVARPKEERAHLEIKKINYKDVEVLPYKSERKMIEVK